MEQFEKNVLQEEFFTKITAEDREKVKEAGRKGGLKSRRSGINNGEGARHNKEYIWKGELGDELVFAKD